MIKETLCEYCVFKVMKNGEQTGCHLNRLDKLPHHQDGLFQIVDTYCSACRNVYWEMGLGVKTISELKDIVMDELKIQYDVVIICDETDSEADVQETLDIITAKSYQPQRVIVAFKYSEEAEKTLRKLAPRYSNTHSFMMSTEEDLHLRLKPVMMKCRAPYLLFVNPGGDYDESVIVEFNEALNVDLKPKILFASAKFYLCPRVLYEKFMYEDSPFASINQYVQSIATANQRPDS